MDRDFTLLTRPPHTHLQPADRNVPGSVSVATLIAVAILFVGCSVASRLPVAGKGTLVLPVRFVNDSGDAALPNERQANLTAWFGAIPGGIFGHFVDEYVSAAIGTSPTLAINLDKLTAALERHSATRTADDVTTGWTISPADTRFARVGTNVKYEDGRQAALKNGFLDQVSDNILILVFFDRPCRLQGAVRFTSREGTPTSETIDVAVDMAGLNWLEMSRNGPDGYKIIRHAPVSLRPQFVVYSKP